MMNKHTHRIPSTITILLFVFLAGLLLGQRTLAAEPVCAAAQCQAQEAEILASTVRIEMEVWTIREDESGFDIESETAHATLVEPRYLVTHNHFRSLEQADSHESSIRMVLFDSSGEVVLKAPLTDFNFHPAGDQTLVFEMKYDYMADRLIAAGLRFAEAEDWKELDLAPGAIVGQVNWDGQTTQVQWTSVEEVIDEEGVPRLALADAIGRGSSGGGVFWNGKLVANNWKIIHYEDVFGRPAFTTSVAALNVGLSGTGE